MEQIIFLLIGLVLGYLSGKFFVENKIKNEYAKQVKQIEYLLQEERIKTVQLQGKLETENLLNKSIKENLKETFESISAKAMQSNNQAFIRTGG